jgi:hypothetical protein
VLQAGRFWTESAEAEDFELIKDSDLALINGTKTSQPVAS